MNIKHGTNTKHNFWIIIKNEKVEGTEQVKYLGVWADNKLTWKSHSASLVEGGILRRCGNVSRICENLLSVFHYSVGCSSKVDNDKIAEFPKQVPKITILSSLVHSNN